VPEFPTAQHWAELRSRRPQSDDQLATLQVPFDGAETAMLLAIDSAGELHLLIPLSADAPPTEPPDLNGLRVRRRVLESGTYLDLVASPSHEHVFSPVCREVIDAVQSRRREPVAAVAAIIRAWQAAWRPSRAGMEKSVQVGLMGELYVLLRLMLPCLGPTAIGQWSGPDKERHDFVSERLHIEVKTTRRSQLEHEISRLDQLRVPEGRSLLFVSIQLEESVGGDITLAHLIDEIVDEVRAEPGVAFEFLSKVEGLGWSDDMRESGELMRFFLRNATVFEVDDEFPRLPDDYSVPSGVIAVQYTVNLANLPSLATDEAFERVRSANQ
jgi:hypothetical protein